jgi:hypothetical protein
MSDTTVSALRDVAAKLERRRDRIARTQHSLGIVIDAYDLVARDLLAAAAARDERQGREETAQ